MPGSYDPAASKFNWWWPTLAWAMLVALLTLSPQSNALDFGSGFCLVCGPTGLADVFRNVILFAPLGCLLFLHGFGVLPLIVTPIVVSVGVEALQILIPGRHPSVGDVLFNSLGGFLGIVGVYSATHTARRLGRPGGGAVEGGGSSRTVLMAGAVLVGWGIFGVSSVLTQRAPVTGSFSVDYRPEFPGRQAFSGEVHGFKAGGVELPEGDVPQGTPPWRAVQAGNSLLFDFSLFGVPDRGESTYVVLEDERGSPLLLFGGRNDHFFFRERRLADVLHLDHPEIQLLDALAGSFEGVRSGRVKPLSSGYCMSLTGSGSQEVCGLGLTAGAGWRYLMALNGVTPGVRAAISFGLLALLGAILIFLAPGVLVGLVGGGFLLVGLFGVSALGPLLPPTVFEWGGCMGGLLMASVWRVAFWGREDS